MLKKLGRVEKTVERKLLLVKISARKIPPLGEKVYTADFKALGKILDIIGREDSPYALIKPYREESSDRVVGENVYVKTKHRARPKRRK